MPATGEALKAARTKRGICQAKLAARINSRQATISHAETGLRLLKVPHLLQIAAITESNPFSLIVWQNGMGLFENTVSAELPDDFGSKALSFEEAAILMGIIEKLPSSIRSALNTQQSASLMRYIAGLPCEMQKPELISHAVTTLL
ncbi:MAG: transcriptional regulator with XRE-family HTH domain [Motiliproteus sp.]|jgi:transcriptional regulator with XRE-family HTH domain